MPWSFTVSDGLEDSSVITSKWPFRSSLFTGAKRTLKLKLLPAARLTGNFPFPSTWKASSEDANCVMRMAADPVFANETFTLTELPSATAPKSTEDGVATRVAGSGLLGAESGRKVTPPQPERNAHAEKEKSKARGARRGGRGCQPFL